MEKAYLKYFFPDGIEKIQKKTVSCQELLRSYYRLGLKDNRVGQSATAWAGPIAFALVPPDQKSGF